jgi:hypothetical protein
MKAEALKLHNLGFSVIPTREDKTPIGRWYEKSKKYTWDESKEVKVEPESTFDKQECKGVGIVCGVVSGNLELIDIDSKYDLNGTLFDDYKKAINDVDKGLLKKLVVETTKNQGYHFVYRCSVIEGNLKLAKRYSTQEEKMNTYNTRKLELIAERDLPENKDNPLYTDEYIEAQSLKAKNGDKNRVLIETRGEGGFFVCAPTEGYKLVYSDFSKVQEITPEERETLFMCARFLNQVYDIATPNKVQKEVVKENLNPFDEWNKKGDVVSILTEDGWKITSTSGSKTILLRPAGKGKKSVDWCEDKRLLYVFSSSTQFENDKAYNPSSVLAKVKFNDDYKATVKWLVANGYGSFTEQNLQQLIKPKGKQEVKVESKVNLDDDDYSFLATKEETDIYIEQKRNGTFKMGALTGHPTIDKHYRFKKAQFEMVLGHDNAGKSIVTWYLSVLDCYFNNEYYIIFGGENSTGALKSKLAEYYLCKRIEDMLPMEANLAKEWVEEHYAIIRNDVSWTYKDMLVMGQKMLKRKKYGKFIIEPYNVLEKETSNEHQYDYKAMLDMRMFIRQTGLGIILNVHAATEALRKTYPKGHEYFGYTMPPNKSDAEGGGKFPNKADNFIVIHRMADHPEQFIWTELHVQKIKEMETGGMRTFRDNPIKLKMCAGGCGFEDVSGYNPMIQGRRKDEQLSLIPELKPIQPNTDFDKPMPTRNMKDEANYNKGNDFITPSTYETTEESPF